MNTLLTRYGALLAISHALLFFPFPSLEAQHSTDQPFRILSGPDRGVGSRWQVEWESQAGRKYVLQRWNGDDLSVAGEPRWQGVTTVTASGPVTQGEDPDTSGTAAR